MRKYQKKQLVEKFNILCDAHSYIEELMKNEQDTSQMLSDCQGVAIEIGTEIENAEGEGTRTVELLEDYCELLFRISERKFPVSPSHMAARTKEELDSLLQLAEESLQKDIEEQSVVVFFPYKASMWDSMETVWRELCATENTTCYVVPIPFYIKDADKNKIKMNYEGGEFPSDVPVVAYEQFLAESVYADIAIYHNPYDDQNNITEVDERFFSSNLHKYAQILVYIPYYVLVGDVLPPAFALTPGVKNADYVVVDNEEVARQYRKWYPKEENKFLPYGSPKIEKAVQMSHLQREELDIPQEWKNRIRGKKVLFYNTHLINFFDESRDFIGKLKEVFAIMQAQDDVVLWWRPHPLSEDMEHLTEESRFREYEELVSWYKQEDIGIYDDSPKLHEAVAAADAYYGDASSVMKLFQAVGKPVMVQEFAPVELLVEDWCIVNDDAWFLVNSYNGLYKLNLKSYKLEFMGCVSNNSKFQHVLYRKLVYHKGKIVLLPSAATKICTYDIEKHTFEEYDFIENECDNKCYSAQIYNDRLYLIPEAIKKMYVFSLETKYLEEVNTVNKYLETEKLQGYTSISSCLINGKLIFILFKSNIIYIYDIEKDIVETKKITKDKTKFFDMIQVDNGIFAIGYDEPKAVYWNMEKDESTEYSLDELCDWDMYTQFQYENYYKQLGYLYEPHSVVCELDIMGKNVCCSVFGTEDLIMFDLEKKTVWRETAGLKCNDLVGFARGVGDKSSFLPLNSNKKFYFSDGMIVKIEDEEILAEQLRQALKEGFINESRELDLKIYLKNILTS